MSALKDFLKTVETDCKALHKNWSKAKDLSEKAWDAYKKEKKNTQELKTMEVEYKKLKFDEDLGPKLDKLHKKDDAKDFDLSAHKIVLTVVSYENQLKSADLPEAIEKPLKKALKEIKEDIARMKDAAGDVFVAEEQEKQDKKVQKGKMVAPFNLVSVDFADEFNNHQGWVFLGTDLPNMTILFRIDEEVVLKMMAKGGIKATQLQDDFMDDLMGIFEKNRNDIDSVLTELFNEHNNQMPPNLAKGEIENIISDIRKEFTKDIGNRIEKSLKKYAANSMNDLLDTI